MRKENILKARHCLAQIAAIEEQLVSGFVVLANGRTVQIPKADKTVMAADLAAIQVRVVDAVNDVWVEPIVAEPIEEPIEELLEKP